MLPPIGEEQVTEGDTGGVDELGTINEDEPSDNGLNVVMSIEAERDFGDGMAEPVEAYSGRSSSGLCAKKHTFLEQPVSSLQRRVLY